MIDSNIKFIDLPEVLFPFTIDALDLDGKVFWTSTVYSAGAIAVPPLGTERVIRITWPDGTIMRSDDPE